jgi:hypothetical protein
MGFLLYKTIPPLVHAFAAYRASAENSHARYVALREIAFVSGGLLITVALVLAGYEVGKTPAFQNFAQTVRSGLSTTFHRIAAVNTATATVAAVPDASGSVDDAPNLNHLTSVSDVPDVAKNALAGRPVRLAVSGYTKAPAGSEAKTADFVGAVVRRIGPARVGLVTSPTASAGSIDAISTELAQREEMPLMYLTAKEYVKYVDTKSLPTGIDRDAYSAVTKYVLPTAAEYSQATAVASNGLLVTGGRQAAISDFVHAVTQGNRVVVYEGSGLPSAWDVAAQRPDNASGYIARQIEAFLSNPKSVLPLPETSGLDKGFLEANLEALSQRVLILRGVEPQQAVAAAASFLDPGATNMGVPSATN